MINGEFVTDPCSLAHHPECKPIRTAHNLVERTVYQFNRKLKSDPSYAGKTPKPLWCEQKSFVKEKAAEVGVNSGDPSMDSKSTQRDRAA
ncbi:hypothetical protein Y032_0008g35 [Ancylostoma ceylanicum]|uniref:Uncharacterized protein n=1 Tax=Ancylostoma ceylanicum TaxID=53326 RepID=A0A016VLF5_9BILA|nr:hypothetical protein Y032_0008g35 [Ancylostoma ceylanicum]